MSAERAMTSLFVISACRHCKPANPARLKAPMKPALNPKMIRCLRRSCSFCWRSFSSFWRSRSSTPFLINSRSAINSSERFCNQLSATTNGTPRNNAPSSCCASCHCCIAARKRSCQERKSRSANIHFRSVCQFLISASWTTSTVSIVSILLGSVSILLGSVSILSESVSILSELRLVII